MICQYVRRVSFDIFDDLTSEIRWFVAENYHRSLSQFAVDFCTKIGRSYVNKEGKYFFNVIYLTVKMGKFNFNGKICLPRKYIFFISNSLTFEGRMNTR